MFDKLNIYKCECAMDNDLNPKAKVSCLSFNLATYDT